MKTALIALLYGLLCGCATIPAFGHYVEQQSLQKTRTTGYATWYSVKSAQKEGTSGTLTASGRRYDESAMTCALPFHPKKANGKRKWGEKYRITNLSNKRSMIVKHLDFGPGKKARAKGVVVDLTPTAFMALGGKLRNGRIRVKVEKI